MKTTGMLSASSIYIQASLCLTPNQKQNPDVIISSSSPNANIMKILGLITRLGISSSLGVAWKTEYILYHLEGSISPSVKYRSCSTGLEYPLPLFYVVIFLDPVISYTRKLGPRNKPKVAVFQEAEYQSQDQLTFIR